MKTHRRRFLRLALAGAGGVCLRALSTGLPVGFFLGRREALAQAGAPPTSLIMSISRQGDALNANCPGSYVQGTVHPGGEDFAATDVDLGGQRFRGARAWSTLPAELRARLCFFHHPCVTAAHTELESLLRLHGAVKGSEGNGVEMLPSMIAQETFPALGTLQEEPISLGDERLTFRDRPLDNLSPTELKALFADTASALDDFRGLRDRTLDALYADVGATGSRAQKAYLERFALSREQAASLGTRLGELLARIPADEDDPNGAVDQVITAVAILRLGISPVVSIHLPFGGDNHDDAGFARETEELPVGLGALNLLWTELAAAGLSDRTTFATLNTFGRTLGTQDGRAHNGDHHVMVMFGPRVAPGVVGGVVESGRDFGASPIDALGAPRANGALGGRDLLAAAGKTLARVVGVSDERLARTLPSGQVIQRVLAGG